MTLSKEMTMGIVTAARNEADYLPRTIDSMLSQKTHPDSWVIVDDGSTDETPRLTHQLIDKYAWISLITRDDRGFDSRGSGNVQALKEGYDLTLSCLAPGLVGTFDADLSFCDTTIQELRDKFLSNPTLGITGGEIVEQNSKGDWKPPIQLPPEFVRAACKVYRVDCYNDIGGIKPIKGWSALDNMVAMSKGWLVERACDIPIKHHRPKGKRDGVRDHMKAASNAWYMNSDPLLVLARGIRRMHAEKPLLLGGIMFLYRYFSDRLNKREQFPDDNIRKFVRLRHRELLKRGYVHW